MEEQKSAHNNEFQQFLAKERSSNFTQKEVNRLSDLVHKYKQILMCKKTDGVSSRQKENVWKSIEKEFNAVGEFPRTLKQLKYKFDNMKRSLKKEASNKRQKMLKTGGGRLTPSPPPSPGHDSAAEWLKTMMSTSVDGNEAIYDDDVIVIKPHKDLEPPSNEQVYVESSIIIEKLPSNEQILVESPTIIEKLPSNEQILVESPTIIEKLPSNEQILVESPTIIEKIAAKEDFFDNSTPHSSLKRPISTPLKKLAKKQKKIEPDFRPEIHKKKLSVIDELHKLEMEKIKKSIERDEALHEQKMRHNEEKHKLELIKIQLEIEKLKK